MVFYAEYIDRIVAEKILPYCESHQPCKGGFSHWGLGSVFYWDDQWGRSFYSFWRNNIEKKGDAIFVDEILPRLPQNWQMTYKFQGEQVKSPHNWNEMSDGEIASVLIDLKKDSDPIECQWWIGSIAYWKGGESKEKWGKSFWSYWRSKVEATGDESFCDRILPLLPEEWRDNFCARETIEWRNMNYRQMAELLSGLQKPTRSKRWYPSQISLWTNADGRAIGYAFRQFWWRCVESSGCEIFVKEILPLLDERLRLSFVPRGFERNLPEAASDKEKDEVKMADDLDQLYQLYIEGNRAAFDKLRDKLELLMFLDCPNIPVDVKTIERAIHCYIPGFRTLRQYTAIRLQMYESSRNRHHLADFEVAVSSPQRRNQGMIGTEEEDLIIGALDD